MRAVLQRNRERVYGTCVAFAPHGFRADLKGYAPYYYWAAAGLQFEQLAKPEYDYFQWPWYRRPRDDGWPMWSEPYFDDGGGQTVMITYSVPARRNDMFWAIVTVNIELARMLQDVSVISGEEQETVGQSAYAFIIDKRGTYLAFPGQNSGQVMNHSLQEKNEPLARAMLSGREGVLRTLDPRDGKQAWVAYAPILIDPMSEDAGKASAAEMSLAIVSAESPALDAAHGLLVTQALIGLGWLTMLFVVIIVVARSISRPSQRRA
jgi:sigma-B regulation protein RsbU (phosphoserine phosphatase)